MRTTKWSLYLVVLLWPSFLVAQSGTLRGVVTDESGAIVQGATITLTNSSGITRTTIAGNDGSYSIDAIAAGEYTAQASAPDLKTGPIKVVIAVGAQTLNLS